MTEVETIRKILTAIWFDKSERDGYIEPETLTDELAKRGYVIIRDPAHAPEAVAIANRVMCCKKGCGNAENCWAKEWDRDDVRAAITAYIERAKG